jgi:hypothetical protein
MMIKLVCFVLSLAPIFANAENLERLNNLRKDVDFEKTTTNLSSKGRVQLFSGQSFRYSQEGLTFAAGEVITKAGRSECFLYVRSGNEPGRVFLIADKAEETWDCAGSPALSAMQLVGLDGPRTAIASLFLYQAPSGDRFNLPFVVDKFEAEQFRRGELDSCVEDKLNKIEIRALKQIRTAAVACSKH